jgi:16S rRNA (guanine(966)-N(2))-methyltransferase RsmD
MAKEALFNILNNHYYFNELTVIDLFAGTGNMSFEFASRGTERILSVDADQGCILFITKTAEELGFKIDTQRSDVFKFLAHHTTQADIIFADPPYQLSLEEFTKIPELVFGNSLLSDQGTLIVEHPKQIDLSHGQNFKNARKYGGSVFSFFVAPE